MTCSCSAKGDEKYLVKGLKCTITMLSFLNWSACRNNAMFSWPVIWWCTNSQDASFDVSLMQRFWWQDSQTHHLMWWCQDSDAQILWCDDQKMWWCTSSGQNRARWYKVGRNADKSRKYTKSASLSCITFASFSQQFSQQLQLFETAQNCKLCVRTSRHAVPFLSLTTWEK